MERRVPFRRVVSRRRGVADEQPDPLRRLPRLYWVGQRIEPRRACNGALTFFSAAVAVRQRCHAVFEAGIEWVAERRAAIATNEPRSA